MGEISLTWVLAMIFLIYDNKNTDNKNKNKEVEL